MGVTLVCTKCKEEKPYKEFYKCSTRETGKKSWCKECIKKYRKPYKRNSVIKKKVEDPVLKSKANREWYEKNSKYHKEYYKQNKEIRARNNRAYEKRNPERLNAIHALYRAVKKGKVIRPDKCSICAKECKPEGHHHDYDKKLEVVWVCRPCHLDIHRKHKFKERVNALKGRDGNTETKA